MTSPKYILHDTWTWFRDDLRRTNPAAFLETQPIDSKPFARYVAGHFETVFTGADATVQLRNDLAGSVLHGVADRPWSPPRGAASGPGWTIDGNAAALHGIDPAGS